MLVASENIPSPVLFWVLHYYSFVLSLAVFEDSVEVDTADPGPLMSARGEVPVPRSFPLGMSAGALDGHDMETHTCSATGILGMSGIGSGLVLSGRRGRTLS